MTEKKKKIPFWCDGTMNFFLFNDRKNEIPFWCDGTTNCLLFNDRKK
jgi:hypothetical protein